MIACRTHNENAVGMLLAAGANPSLGNRKGYTPLMSALENGRNEIVGTLLTCNANVHATNTRQETALLLATKLRGHDVIVGLLLATGAHVDL